MVVLILFCVVLFIIILWRIYYASRKQVGPLPPLAGGALPIVGHSWLGFVKNERLYKVFMEEILAVNKHEEAACILLGPYKFYVCMDPSDGYTLMNSCQTKDAFYKFFNALFGENGLLTADVLTWKKHRKLFNPAFNQNVLDTYFMEFNEQSRHLVKLLTQEVGKPYFDPLPYLNQTVMRITCATIMGVRVDYGKDIIEEYGKAADIYMTCMVERVRKVYFHSDFFFNLSSLKKKQNAAVKIMHDLTSEVIRDKKRNKHDQEHIGTDRSAPRFKSFLDLLLDMGKDGALSDSEIKQEVNTFIVGALDSTYHAVGMTLLTIGSYPDVQQKIYDEIHAVLDGSTLDLKRQDMLKLKYLEAVIKETMRLYPAVCIFGRTLDKDIKLKTYTLPAGSRCFVSVYHLGRHRIWGADADQFRPERWLDGSLPANTGAYAVFGLGKRHCIGSNFAMNEMKTILCHVVHRYRISGDITRLVQNLSIFNTPVSGHHISIEQRNFI